jgi:hypothetical protein
MGKKRSEGQEKSAYMEAAEEMYDELREWRGQHLAADFDEIARQVTVRRRGLMGLMLKQLAEAGDERVEAPTCNECGERMTYKGTSERGVDHKEGAPRIERGYYRCAACASTFFPPGQAAEVDEARLECGDGAGGGAVRGGDSVL